MERNLKFLAFWSINDKLDLDRICSQLDEMKKVGYDGAIWHMRFYPYPKSYLGREYMDTVSEVILYAKKIGLEFWLYDENGWPSGQCSGKVKKAYPSCKYYWLVPKGKKGYKLKHRRSVNVMDKKSVDVFIELTHEAYKNNLKKEAFDYVTGFFSDEVGFTSGAGIHSKHGYIPWTPEVDEIYFSRYGEKPEKHFYKLWKTTEDAEDFKLRYWNIISEILANNFYKRINDWCQKHGKKYTAHLKAEENPFFQIEYSGSPYTCLKEVSVPAVDALERYRSSNYFPRIASSLAKQFQSGEALTEAIGGSGFGLTPKDFYNYIDWLADCGHSTFVLHICQYCHKGSAVRDWPPDIPFTETWKDAFPKLIASLKDKYKDKDIHNTSLVVVPTARVMRKYQLLCDKGINDHNGIGNNGTDAADISNTFIKEIEQYYTYNPDFDVTDENIIEQFGVWENGGLTIGNEHYTDIVYSADCYFKDAQTEEKLHGCAKTLTEFLADNKDAEKVRKTVEGFGLDDKLREKIQLAERYAEWTDKTDGVYGFKVSSYGENTIQFVPPVKKCSFSTFKFRFEVSSDAEIGELELLFTDPVNSLKINGQRLKAEGSFDKFTAKFTPKPGINTFSYRLNMRNGHMAHPFVFLNGEFLVKSHAGYSPLEGDPHQVVTGGEFYLDTPKTGMSAKDLIEAGFPFMHSSVTVSADIDFAGKLELNGLFADAAEVFIDGKSYGFIYDGNNEIGADDIESGRHKVELKMFPSTYNKFGPHHHYEGDRHICSPLQFKGKKAFADWDDAPKNTLDSKWRFVKFGI